MKIFVYGTLKRWGSNHNLIDHCTFLGEAYTNKDYTLVESGLPYLLEQPGEGCLGEVFEIDSADLIALDRLEGHPNFYRREIITVRDLDTKAPIEVYVYLYPHKITERVTVIKSY